MKHNVGSLDRLIRLVLGILAIAAGFVYQGWLIALGAVLVFTALAGWCPPYSLLGINTCRTK